MLPIRIPGTNIIVDPLVQGTDEYLRYMANPRKSLLQILCEDAVNPKPPILEPYAIHALWNGLRAIYEEGEESFGFFDFEGKRAFMGHFYSDEARRIGAEAGDLSESLQQLHHEMRTHFLLMNAAIVYENDGLVSSLNGAELPITITPLTVSVPANFQYISLSQFQEAGGHIIAHGTQNTPAYLSGYSDIQAVMWMLGECSVDGPSNHFDLVNIDGLSAPILRGKVMNI